MGPACSPEAQQRTETFASQPGSRMSQIASPVEAGLSGPAGEGIGLLFWAQHVLLTLGSLL